ncbi:hypothetical protein [Marinovum algicola]|uniref:phage head spike fiber domain-containing protein n=1 Tax=Marinovum algicola TaxID=42444 RepID=UPI00352B8206
MQSVFDVGVPGPFDRNLIGGRNAAPSVARPFLAGDLAPAVVADFAGAAGRERYAKPLPILGPELVTNGGFDVDTTGWNNNGLTTFEATGGRLHAIANSNGDSFSQDVAVESGRYYLLIFDYDVETSVIYDGTGVQWTGGSVSGQGSVSHSFVTSSPTARVEFMEGGASDNAEFYIDNVSVREITGYRAVRTTFTDLLTHSRSGNATMVDRDGLLKWAPHNLLTYSEDFTNAAWTDGSISGGSRSSGALSVSSSEGYAYAQQAISVATGVAHTIEVDVTCDATVSNVPLRAGLGASNDASLVDFSAGETKRISFAVTPTSGTLTIGLDARNAVVPGGSDETGYTITLNKASAYRSDLGGMVDNPDTGDSYVPTTNAARFLPRRNHCTYDLAVGEITGPNLIGNGQFAQGFAGWGAYRNATLSAASGALRVTSDAATTGASASRSFATVPGKAYALRFEKVAVSVGGRARVAIGHHGDLGNAASTDLADAYYDGADGPYEVRFIAEQATTWVILANQNASTSYVEFDNVSCFEVLPGVVQGYLHESEARTNLIERSMDVSNGYWVKSSKITAVDSTTLSVSGATDQFNYINRSISLTSGQTYTLSCEAKKGSSDRVWLLGETSGDAFGVFNLTDGTYEGNVSFIRAANDAQIEPLGDGWYLCSITFTKTSATASEQIGFGIGNGTVPADGDLQIRHMQFEQAATPSSRIPTNGATATRPADSLTIPAANLPYHPDGVWMAMRGQMTYADTGAGPSSGGAGGEACLYLWKNGSTDWIDAVLSGTTTRTGEMNFRQREGASGLTGVNTGPSYYSPGVNVPFSVAARHGPTYVNGAADGVALSGAAPTALANLAAIDFSLGQNFMGIFKSFAMNAGSPADAGIAGVSA